MPSPSSCTTGPYVQGDRNQWGRSMNGFGVEWETAEGEDTSNRGPGASCTAGVFTCAPTVKAGLGCLKCVPEGTVSSSISWFHSSVILLGPCFQERTEASECIPDESRGAGGCRGTTEMKCLRGSHWKEGWTLAWLLGCALTTPSGSGRMGQSSDGGRGECRENAGRLRQDYGGNPSWYLNWRIQYSTQAYILYLVIVK